MRGNMNELWQACLATLCFKEHQEISLNYLSGITASLPTQPNPGSNLTLLHCCNLHLTLCYHHIYCKTFNFKQFNLYCLVKQLLFSAEKATKSVFIKYLILNNPKYVYNFARRCDIQFISSLKYTIIEQQFMILKVIPVVCLLKIFDVFLELY